MNIVLFTHPAFMNSQSMPRFAAWIADGMKQRGHTVTLIRPKGAFYKLPVPGAYRKWMGYIDQFLLFPSSAKRFAKKQTGEDTLFVFADNALGPWVPLVADRRHVIHCHDFLAQNGALGNIAELNISWTGKRYQEYIRKGLAKGKNFICISQRTKKDLLELPGIAPKEVFVVYNGLTQQFTPGLDVPALRSALSAELKTDLRDGFFMHIGGDLWYKNKRGIVGMYEAWRAMSSRKLPLLLMGAAPGTELADMVAESAYRDGIHFILNPTDALVRTAYQAATALLFPSLAEGFGWPIVEAMASGIPVITTNEAPMNEVGGSAAFYVNRFPEEEKEQKAWADESANVLERVAGLSAAERSDAIASGMQNAKRFDSQQALDQIEAIYKDLIKQSA